MNSQLQSPTWKLLCCVLSVVASPLAGASDGRTGAELEKLTRERIFNSNVHKVVLKVHYETENRVLSGTDQLGRVEQFCFFQSVPDPNPEICIQNVGYRVRGHSSRWRMKRQYKVVFDIAGKKNVFERNGNHWATENEPERDFYGLKTLNLRSGGTGTNDDSIAREMLASRIFNVFSLPSIRGGIAYRVAHAKLFVEYCDNGGCSPWNYKGLYYMAEDVDKVFVKTRFSDSKKVPPGVLYSSAHAGAQRADFTLNHLGPHAYDVEFDSRPDDLRTKTENALQDEMRECEQPVQEKHFPKKDVPGGKLICATIKRLEKIIAGHNVQELKELFDVPSIYLYMAGANFTGHWDSLWANANNDSLFFNQKMEGKFGGKWQILVWDLDMTFGNQAGEQISASHDKMPIRERNALFNFILSEPTLKAEFEATYREILRRTDRTRLNDSLNRIENRVETEIRGTWEEGQGIDYGAAFRYLRDFINARWDSVRHSLGM